MLTLSTLKSRLSLPDSDVLDDALLQVTLAAVIARFDRETNRTLAYSAAAIYEFQADSTEIIPDHLPITAVASFETKSDEASGWTPCVAEYLIRRATVISLPAALGSASDLARVTYSGGYVSGAFPSDLAFAAQEQCAYWYQNRHRVGLTSVSSDAGSIQQFAAAGGIGQQLDLLPSVRQTLNRYTRNVH